MSPFDLFHFIGERTHKEQGISLEQYTDIVVERLSELSAIKKEVLRDMMVFDWLKTNSSGRLPTSLHRYDEKIKTIKSYLETEQETRRKKNIKRHVAILYTWGEVIYCDYYQGKRPKEDHVVHRLPLLSFLKT